MKRPIVRTLAGLALAALLGAMAWAMFAAIPPGPREQVFAIPAGTWERRAKGDLVDILPPEIRLTLGVKDILLLRNQDKVPQIFGPVLIMPGQSFTMPFDRASDYEFECAAHSSGKMRIVVEPEPTPGWRRLVWRLKQLSL